MSLWFKRPVIRLRSKESVMTVQFSPDDRQLAVGAFDGSVHIYDINSSLAVSDFSISRENKNDKAKLPCTSLRFHPLNPILLVCGSDGTVEKRDLRACEAPSWHIKEEGNEVYCCDYRRDGTAFATAGSDGTLRVYDDHTNQLMAEYSTHSEHTVNCQAVRLYSVVFSPDDPNVLLTCGWANTIHYADLREKHLNKKREIFGPYMIGDALDIRGSTILAGCNKLDTRVQLFDVATQHLTEVAWPTQNQFAPNCAKFSHDPSGEFIAVGGGGLNGLVDAGFVMERKSGKCVVDATMEGSVNVCAFGWKDQRVAFGDSVGTVQLYERGKK
jgi:WD40 repeat protein